MAATTADSSDQSRNTGVHASAEESLHRSAHERVEASDESRVGTDRHDDSVTLQVSGASGIRQQVTSARFSGGGMPAGLKVLMVGALATVACAGLNQISDIVMPLFFALTLVLTVRPIHRKLVSKGVPAWVSAFITLMVILLTLLLIFGLMAWSLVGLPDVIREYTPAFQQAVQDVLEFAEKQGFATDQITSTILGSFNVSQALNTVMSAASSLTSVGSFVAVMALCLLFLTVDTLTMKARGEVVRNHDSMLYEALASFEGRVRQYWLVSTIFGLVVAAINFIVLQFLNVPMPLAWALFSFITNYIPNIGFVIGVIPPAVMGALDSGWLTGVWVIVAFSVINALIQGVLQPKITGEAVGLSTIVTFVSLLFWTAVVGPLGTIMAVPLTLFAKALLIDSNAQTRWIGTFLVPEGEAARRAQDGYFDEESPNSEIFVDFTAENSEKGKRIRSTLQSLSRRKRGSRTEQN
ncbi:AI-2E family transporter [Arcanobacterium haemolyticum]|nr:AI-2E family transporter [Arcanobacterium haemolyticum]